MKTSIRVLSIAEYKSLGHGWTVQYGIHESAFGPILIGLLGRAVCALMFAEDGRAAASLKRAWPLSFIRHQPEITQTMARDLPAMLLGEKVCALALRGTAFQVAVWKALLTIPLGSTASYSGVAEMAGRPSAVRAAANAVAGNPVAILVPCHRVIAKSGDLHRYGGGVDKKRELLEWESNPFFYSSDSQ